jgi:uncharacterized protein DUF5666
MFTKSNGGRLAALLACAALIACGGGSSPPGGTPPGATTGVTRGVISSSSALVVNGVTFSAAAAKISVDGVSGQSASELRKGRIATIKGSFDDKSGTATEIEISSACEGMVSHKSGPELEVGGQVVKADGQTEFEDNAQGLDSIAEGERVEVHGFPDDSGAIRATRIEKRSGSSDDFEVTGFVANLNAAAVPPTFDLLVAPAAATGFHVTLGAGVSLPAGLKNGSQVEVKSAGPASATGEILASALQLEDEKLGDANLHVEVEGLVISGNAASFQVGNQMVVTTASTVFAHGTAADVIPGARVEVEGTLDAQGVLQASKVSFETSIRLQAVPSEVNAIDPQTGTLVLLGITVHTDALTEFKDSQGQPVDLQHLGASGVAVRGALHRNGTDVVATSLELTDDQRIELRGPVSAKDAAAHSLTILGVRVNTASAEFEGMGSSDEASFFSKLALGDIVGVRGKDAGAFNGSVLTAEKVELEGD